MPIIEICRKRFLFSGSCLSRTSSESSIDSAAADTELLADLVDGAVAASASAGDLPDHEVSGSVGPRDDREQNVKTDDVIVQLESPPRVPPVSAAAIAATPPRGTSAIIPKLLFHKDWSINGFIGHITYIN